MATKNDTPVDKDKEVLMEVRGIIDGCLDSGSTDYKTALEQISDISTAYLCGASDNIKRSQCNGGALPYTAKDEYRQ